MLHVDKPLLVISTNLIAPDTKHVINLNQAFYLSFFFFFLGLNCHFKLTSHFNQKQQIMIKPSRVFIIFIRKTNSKVFVLREERQQHSMSSLG